MRTARMLILLAVVGQGTCGTGRTHVNDPSVTTDKKFETGHPALPSGMACLDWPMEKHRQISSRFMDPKHPFVPGKHDGVDLPAEVGTPVLAPAPGEVIWVRHVALGQDASVGVRFSDGWEYYVHHLSRMDMAKGQVVELGNLLGLSGGAVGAPGSGPWTTGPHLHFSLMHAGAYVNPLPYLCP